MDVDLQEWANEHKPDNSFSREDQDIDKLWAIIEETL